MARTAGRPQVNSFHIPFHRSAAIVKSSKGKFRVRFDYGFIDRHLIGGQVFDSRLGLQRPLLNLVAKGTSHFRMSSYFGVPLFEFDCLASFGFAASPMNMIACSYRSKA